MPVISTLPRILHGPFGFSLAPLFFHQVTYFHIFRNSLESNVFHFHMFLHFALSFLFILSYAYILWSSSITERALRLHNFWQRVFTLILKSFILFSPLVSLASLAMFTFSIKDFHSVSMFGKYKNLFIFMFPLLTRLKIYYLTFYKIYSSVALSTVTACASSITIPFCYYFSSSQVGTLYIKQLSSTLQAKVICIVSASMNSSTVGTLY